MKNLKENREKVFRLEPQRSRFPDLGVAFVPRYRTHALCHTGTRYQASVRLAQLHSRQLGKSTLYARSKQHKDDMSAALNSVTRSLLHRVGCECMGVS